MVTIVLECCKSYLPSLNGHNGNNFFAAINFTRICHSFQLAHSHYISITERLSYEPKVGLLLPPRSCCSSPCWLRNQDERQFVVPRMDGRSRIR